MVNPSHDGKPDVISVEEFHHYQLEVDKQFEGFRTSAVSFKEDLNGKHAVISTLTQELHEAAEINVELRQQLGGGNEIIHTVTAHKEELHARVGTTDDAKYQEFHQYQEAMDEQFQELRDASVSAERKRNQEVKLLKTQISRGEDCNVELRAQVVDCIKTKALLETERASMQGKFQKVEQKLESTAQLLAGKDEDFETFQEEIDRQFQVLRNQAAPPAHDNIGDSRVSSGSAKQEQLEHLQLELTAANELLASSRRENDCSQHRANEDMQLLRTRLADLEETAQREQGHSSETQESKKIIAILEGRLAEANQDMKLGRKQLADIQVSATQEMQSHSSKTQGFEQSIAILESSVAEANQTSNELLSSLGSEKKGSQHRADAEMQLLRKRLADVEVAAQRDMQSHSSEFQEFKKSIAILTRKKAEAQQTLLVESVENKRLLGVASSEVAVLQQGRDELTQRQTIMEAQAKHLEKTLRARLKDEKAEKERAQTQHKSIQHELLRQQEESQHTAPDATYRKVAKDKVAFEMQAKALQTQVKEQASELIVTQTKLENRAADLERQLAHVRQSAEVAKREADHKVAQMQTDVNRKIASVHANVEQERAVMTEELSRARAAADAQDAVHGVVAPTYSMPATIVVGPPTPRAMATTSPARIGPPRHAPARTCSVRAMPWASGSGMPTQLIHPSGPLLQDPTFRTNAARPRVEGSGFVAVSPAPGPVFAAQPPNFARLGPMPPSPSNAPIGLFDSVNAELLASARPRSRVGSYTGVLDVSMARGQETSVSFFNSSNVQVPAPNLSQRNFSPAICTSPRNGPVFTTW